MASAHGPIAALMLCKFITIILFYMKILDGPKAIKHTPAHEPETVVSKETVFLGIDLGASRGRGVLGRLRGKTLSIEEILRFPNRPVRMNDTLYWDIPALWLQLMDALRTCAQRGFVLLDGIGVDSWGVDFGLFGRDGRLPANCVHYRDTRTENIEPVITGKISPYELFRLTGLPLGRVTSLAQLVALERQKHSDLLKIAYRWQMIPGVLRYLLSGEQACELTCAGSSQLINVRTGKWCRRLFKLFDLPMRIMPPIVNPGTIVGPLLPDVARAAGFKQASVVAVAGHDTAAAAAITDEQTAFLSCGTWSVLGIEVEKPMLSESAARFGFVNEIGLGAVLFVKNLMGMYLLERLRDQWCSKGKTLSFDLVVYRPRQAAEWDRAYETFLKVTQ